MIVQLPPSSDKWEQILLGWGGGSKLMPEILPCRIQPFQGDGDLSEFVVLRMHPSLSVCRPLTINTYHKP